MKLSSPGDLLCERTKVRSRDVAVTKRDER
jgi:hypothetical protein